MQRIGFQIKSKKSSSSLFIRPPGHEPRQELAATQLRKDVLSEVIADLAMARNGLVNTGLGIAVPVMPSSVPHQHAASPFDLFDQRGSFHATAISATMRIPGNSPLVRSV